MKKITLLKTLFWIILVLFSFSIFTTYASENEFKKKNQEILLKVLCDSLNEQEALPEAFYLSLIDTYSLLSDYSDNYFRNQYFVSNMIAVAAKTKSVALMGKILQKYIKGLCLHKKDLKGLEIEDPKHRGNLFILTASKELNTTLFSQCLLLGKNIEKREDLQYIIKNPDNFNPLIKDILEIVLGPQHE